MNNTLSDWILVTVGILIVTSPLAWLLVERHARTKLKAVLKEAQQRFDDQLEHDRREFFERLDQELNK